MVPKKTYRPGKAVGRAAMGMVVKAGIRRGPARGLGNRGDQRPGIAHAVPGHMPVGMARAEKQRAIRRQPGKVGEIGPRGNARMQEIERRVPLRQRRTCLHH